LLAELPPAALPTADLFPEVVMEANNSNDGKIYAVTEKFGYNTISFDKTKVDPADMNDMSIVLSDKYKGRIAIYDYYLPIVGLAALSMGKNTADIAMADMPAISDTLGKMKAISKQVSDVVSSQTALATGEVDILIGGGEWITGVLSAEKPNLDWTIPSQGAVRWSQSIGVMKASKKQELAQKFVQYIVSPEGQARLATSSCYWAMPANAKAGEFLTAEQKTALRWDQQAEYLKKAQLYPVPSAELDQAMQDAWTNMLQQ
jgi:spermidine/putrescine transport system substrate-binding protein